MLPFLFVVFVLIEIIEFYFSDKIDNWVKNAKKSSVAVGALTSILPQCGFSVIASSLYTRKLLTRGCLIAVYLGTSDESIPILLAYPEKAHLIIPIVGIKLFVAIFSMAILSILHLANKTTTKRKKRVITLLKQQKKSMKKAAVVTILKQKTNVNFSCIL